MVIKTGTWLSSGELQMAQLHAMEVQLEAREEGGSGKGVQPLLSPPFCIFCGPSPISGAPYGFKLDVFVMIHFLGGKGR